MEQDTESQEKTEYARRADQIITILLISTIDKVKPFSQTLSIVVIYSDGSTRNIPFTIAGFDKVSECVCYGDAICI